MTQRSFDDPVIELTHRLGGEPEDTLDFSLTTSDEDAELLLEVLDEVEAEENARDIAGRLRSMGHAL